MNGGDFTYVAQMEVLSEIAQLTPCRVPSSVSHFPRYYAAKAAPNGTYNGWLFSAIPNALQLADQCYALLYAAFVSYHAPIQRILSEGAGVTTISSAWPETVRANSFDLISLLAAGRHGTIA